MENLDVKEDFLRNQYAPKLQQLDANTPGKWGKMNVQQMIEHMSDYVRIASGATPMTIVTPADRIEKMQQFLESEKPFKENTPNQLMADEPVPVRHETKEVAIAELQTELQRFFEGFKMEPDRKIANPFFGELNFAQQVQLLHKHATHHLRQFGAAV